MLWSVERLAEPVKEVDRVVLTLAWNDEHLIRKSNPRIGNLDSLLPLTEDIIGFFIIENHVLRTTRSFRSQREVEELWDVVVTRLVQVVQAILKNEGDVDTFLGCKDVILSFIQTLEVGLLLSSSLVRFVDDDTDLSS